jgi:lantibiotic biosynthesis protein
MATTARPEPWHPLLHGELADAAWAAVHDIARALEEDPDGRHDSYEGRGASVAGGRAGIALFHAYLAEALAADPAAADRQAELAGQRLDEAIEALASTPMSIGLYAGFPGIAWTAEHLGRRVEAQAQAEPAGEEDGEPEDGEDDDVNAEIDAALLEALQRSPWNDQYDLISGLVGVGVYAVERFPRPSGVRCLEAVIDRLEELAERQGDEVTWFTAPELLPPESREQTPHGYYNLGVAHGVPGVIALLGDACRLGVQAERARPLLEGAVRWLLGQRLPESSEPGGFCYATFAGQGIERRAARLAWCYGDPGIAATLLAAARSVGRLDWEREALDIAVRSASAAPERAGVRDAGLCHGALSLAHLFNRFHQAGGAADGELFAGAARGWYRRGLDLRQPDRPLGGFVAWGPGEDREMAWQDDPGFLTGAAGVGLALLAGLTGIEPEWDRLLQVDIPAGPP